MSATRPASVFSIGIMARSAWPDSTALKASSKVGHGKGSISGNMLRHAVSEFAPGSPWKAILFVFVEPIVTFLSPASGALFQDPPAYPHQAVLTGRSRRRFASPPRAPAIAPAVRVFQASQLEARRTARVRPAYRHKSPHGDRALPHPTARSHA